MKKLTILLTGVCLSLTTLSLSTTLAKANSATCNAAALKGKSFCEENSGCGLLPAKNRSNCKNGCELMMREWTAFCNSPSAK